MNDINVLVTKFQNKDQNAFKKLYSIYSDSIYGIIHNIVKDKAIAEDLVQDTFLKTWQNSESYCPKKGRFFTWLVNIARHGAIDKLRSKNYKMAKNNLGTDSYLYDIASHNNLDNHTNAIGLKQHASKLSPKRFEIIDLIFFKGYTQKQVSEELDIPLGTVKTRSRNSILKLRTFLL